MINDLFLWTQIFYRKEKNTHKAFKDIEDFTRWTFSFTTHIGPFSGKQGVDNCKDLSDINIPVKGKLLPNEKKKKKQNRKSKDVKYIASVITI